MIIIYYVIYYTIYYLSYYYPYYPYYPRYPCVSLRAAALCHSYPFGPGPGPVAGPEVHEAAQRPPEIDCVLQKVFLSEQGIGNT